MNVHNFKYKVYKAVTYFVDVQNSQFHSDILIAHLGSDPRQVSVKRKKNECYNKLNQR